MAYTYQQKTSFARKNRHKGPQIAGTVPSLHNNLLLTSIGVPSIDQLVGCVPVGAVFLIEEDKHRSYSQNLMKYFVAEGIVCDHDIFLASADTSVHSFMKELPSPLESKSIGSSNSSSDDLKIAWRYKNNHSKDQTGISNAYCIGRNFDLTKALTNVNEGNVTLYDVLEKSTVTSCCYQQLLHAVRLKLTEGGFIATNGTPPSKIMRIAIPSLGSPLWPCESGNNQVNLLKFLYHLRGLLRNACASCIISVPTYLWKGSSFIPRLRHLCDTVIRLESFVSSDKPTNPAYKDYHGLFYIEKLPRLNALVSHQEHTRDLAFKLGKKKFVVDKFCLPPLDAEEPRIQNFCTSKGSGNKSLDF